MKRPIDPNLASAGDNDFLLELNSERELGFTTNDTFEAKPEPNFLVTEKEESAEAVEKAVEEIAVASTVAAASVSASEGTHHSSNGEHHHHSSDGTHHHSSDGTHHHHSSSGSHHSSSGSHHSSSGSHHSSSGSHHSSSSSHHSSSSSHHSSSSSHHHSSSSHHSSKKKKKSSIPLPAKIAIGILIAIFLALLITVITFFVLRAMGRSDVMPDKSNTAYQETIEYNGHTYKYNDDMFAMGFIGVDQRELKLSDETDFVGAADTDIVVAVNTKTGKTTVIAIPRDTMIDMNIYTKSGVMLRSENSQLCLAYAYGDGGAKSCENSIDAMSHILLNIPIQKYFALDLDGIKPLNDAIGGVTVDATYDIPEQGIYAGKTVTLKGDMAEAYIRRRDMDNINASLNRTQRQMQYIRAYFTQVLPAIVKDFSVAQNLYNTAIKYSQSNISLSNATYLGTLVLSKGIRDFDGTTLQGEMKPSDNPLIAEVVHAEFYPDEDNVMQTVLSTFYTQVD